METCRHDTRICMKLADGCEWEETKLQAQTGNLLCLFDRACWFLSARIHSFTPWPFRLLFVCFFLQHFLHFHQYTPLYWLVGRGLSWICRDFWRDSVCECLCVFFIHKFGQRRGSHVFCYTLPITFSISTTDWRIAAHPSARPAFISLLTCQMLQPKTFQDLLIC